MPEETHRHLYEIQVEGAQAKDALDRILTAIEKVETAVVEMGTKFDAAMGRVVEPIKLLAGSVDNLNASLMVMRQRMGDPAAFQAISRGAQQATVDLRHLRQTIEQYRAPEMEKEGGGPLYRLRAGMPGAGPVRSRKWMVEQYMAGQFGPTPTPMAPTMGPTMLQYEETARLAQNLGLSVEELAAKAESGTVSFATQTDAIELAGAATQRTTSDFASQGQMLDTVLETHKRYIATLREQTQLSSGVTAAMDQEAASTTRLAGAVEMLNQVRTRQQSLWQQLKTMGGDWQQTVAAGAQVAQQLRQQAGAFTRQMGAAIAEGARQGQPGGWTAATLYGPEARPGLQRGPAQRAFGGRMWGAEETADLEQAMGRKIVLQRLLARGATDVAEKFEKQFRVTRSKTEILAEVARTGTMTAEMEKELGLQAEGAGRRASRAGNMFRYFGRYLLRYLLLWQGIQAVRGVARAWFAAHVEMADAVADFGWRVTNTAEDLERYRQKLRDVSMAVGMPVAEIASPLAGRMTEADLLRAAEAAKVFGGSVEDWARKIDGGTASLDAYAYGLRISTLATKDYATLVENASDIAQEFNMTEAETIGMLSALPTVIQGNVKDVQALVEAWAELYEQNQLLMNLGMAPAVTVGPGGLPQRRPMWEVMADIGRQPIEQQRQLAIAMGLTGREQQKFLDAAAGWAEVTQAIRDTVGATGDFSDATAAMEDSFTTRVDRMKTAWAGLVGAIGDTSAIKAATSNITYWIRGLTETIEEPKKAWEAFVAAWEVATPWEKLALAIMGPEAAFIGAGMIAEGETRAAARTEAEAAGRAAGAGAGGGVPGAAYFPPMPVTRLPAGMTMAQVASEMERVIDEVFTRPYVTASGEVVQVTKEQIKALRENTIVVDETGTAVGLLAAYAPALSMATENLRTEVQQFNLERLRDITPEEFERAKREILPRWEARLAGIEGFEEQQELHNFFVGMNDTFMQMLGTETAISYTLQDILDVEKDQLEGMWNIPTGAILRVPLSSLDLMRWMGQGTGGGAGVPTDLMGPLPPALESAALAQDNAAAAMHASANAQNAAAQAMVAQKQVDLEQYMTWAEAERFEYAAREPAAEHIPGAGGHGRRGRPRGRPFREMPMAAPAAVSPWAPGGLHAQFVISLVSTLLLDGKVVAEAVQTELARQLVNTTRSTSGQGSHLRP